MTSGMCEDGLMLRAADKELIDSPYVKSLVTGLMKRRFICTSCRCIYNKELTHWHKECVNVKQ